MTIVEASKISNFNYVWQYFRKRSTSLKCLFAISFSIIVLFSRAPDAFLNPQFWAEDGSTFFEQQANLGLAAFLEPYAGYLHLIPRLTSLIASPFPASLAPKIYMVGVVLMAVWAIVTLFSARTSFNMAFALTLFLAPHTGEVFGTITNVQWFMSLLIPVIASTDSPAGRVSQINQRVLIVIIGLSGPFSMFALPIFAYRLYWRRDRHGIWIACLGAMMAATQIYTITGNFVSFTGEREPVHLALTILDRWFGILAHGWRSENPFTLALTVLFACIVIVTATKGEERQLMVGMLVFCGAILGAAWLKFMPGLSHQFDWPSVDDRYFFIARTYSIWILIVGAVSSQKIFQILSISLLFVLPWNYESHDHNWWQRKPLPDRQWSIHAQKIDQNIPALIEINPTPWTVAVPSALRAK